MFLNCKKIKAINFSYFDTQNITDMSHMFDGCTKLKYLNLSKFNTEKVNNMEFMFNKCFSLEELYLTSFKLLSSFRYIIKYVFIIYIFLFIF